MLNRKNYLSVAVSLCLLGLAFPSSAAAQHDKAVEPAPVDKAKVEERVEDLKVQERVTNSGHVMRELADARRGVPTGVLNKAECVIVLPSVKKAAWIWGASYGRGVMTCRTGENFDGPWSAPTMMKSTGISFGFQGGVEAKDFVILVMNDKGARALMNGKVKLGGDYSIAAGPVGRGREFATNGSMSAKLLSYARTRGVFVGVSLAGATLGPDKIANVYLYGKRVTSEQVIDGQAGETPPSAKELLAVLEAKSPQNLSAGKGGQTKEQERVTEAGHVMKALANSSSGVPTGLLNKADCVIILPSVKKAAFVVGASYGRGVMTCRSGQNFDGPWSAPTMMQSTGGSFGLQAGGEATDFVLLVMNDKGARALMKGKLKLGADAAIAAGPVGREAEAATNAGMNAEMLSYSRAQGVFAGVSLEGSTLGPDNDANKSLYGKKLSAEQIIGGQAGTPPSANELLAVLEVTSPKNFSAGK